MLTPMQSHAYAEMSRYTWRAIDAGYAHGKDSPEHNKAHRLMMSWKRRYLNLRRLGR